MPNSENQNSINQQAFLNKMAIVNFTQCEILLKKHYKIPAQKSIIVRNIQFGANTNLFKLNDTSASDIVNFNYFHPDTYEKLNLSICSNVTTIISMPYKREEELNMLAYKKTTVYKGIIDIYDKNSKGFQSRCFPIKDPDTGSDTTINSRRTLMYQNQTINCENNCTYDGLDENKYVLCKCSGDIQDDGNDTNSGISNNSTGLDILVKFPEFNYDIFLCFEATFLDVFIFYLLFNFNLFD